MTEAPGTIKAQRTMLIVDDQQSVRTTLDYLLGLDGYRVLTAESGTAAIALAEKEQIDGAMIDVHMPVMDGFATCERLRTITQTLGRPLKVWFMSGAVSGSLRRRSFELGALGVFSKPFNPMDLTNRLEAGFLPPSAAAAPPAPNPLGEEEVQP